ncbi:MAG: hypothetical protein GY702_13615 [Desulfobulbaceae bacterium]|nr:hypothetical protein [Desulfobulbaceae bacterium]
MKCCERISFITMIMKWCHTSDFSVDNSVCIAWDDEAGITNLAQYILRSPFSANKISYNDDTGMVVYCSKMMHGKTRKLVAEWPGRSGLSQKATTGLVNPISSGAPISPPCPESDFLSPSWRFSSINLIEVCV